MLNGLKVSILFGILLTLFQNCTQDEGFRSRAFVVKAPTQASTIADDDVADSSSSNGNGTLGGAHETPTDGNSACPLIDPATCFSDYFSIFSWDNSQANLMNEKPILGTKLGTLALAKAMFVDSPIFAGWSAEVIIQSIPGGATKTSVRFLKGNPTGSEAMDCYLMRVSDEATLVSGLANTLFQDVGADQSANTLTGFIRYDEQFIACRVRTGRGETIFRGNSDIFLNLTPNQAFVIKRGCYQTPVAN